MKDYIKIIAYNNLTKKKKILFCWSDEFIDFCEKNYYPLVSRLKEAFDNIDQEELKNKLNEVASKEVK